MQGDLLAWVKRDGNICPIVHLKTYTTMKKQPVFPTKIADRAGYYNTAVPYLNDDANKVRLGISIGNNAKLVNGLAAWQNIYDIWLNPNLRTKLVTKDRDIADKFLMATMQTVYRDIPASKLTSEDRNILNLQLRAKPTEAPEITTRPIASINVAQFLRHTIRLCDEDTPNSRAKPDRVRGVQIWRHIGLTKSEDINEFELLPFCTTTRFTIEFNPEDAGKTASYLFRWVNTRGEVGPWSEISAAMITKM